MAIFNSYVSLPEGIHFGDPQLWKPPGWQIRWPLGGQAPRVNRAVKSEKWWIFPAGFEHQTDGDGSKHLCCLMGFIGIYRGYIGIR